MIKRDPQYWTNEFIKDRNDPNRLKWLGESNDARAYMENNFDPLAKEGLASVRNPAGTEKPWLKLSSMRPRVLSVLGRMYFNPLDPGVVPYEGEMLEEHIRLSANSVFKFEMADDRGVDSLNLLEELQGATYDSLVDGFGVTSHVGDPSLMDRMFIYGKPLHYRIDPQLVLFDRKALSNQKKRHVHIITPLSKTNIMSFYDLKEDEVSSAAKSLLHPKDDIYEVVETQWKEIELVKTYVLTDEIAKELGVNTLILAEPELRATIKAMKDKGFNVDAKVIMKGLPHVKRQFWVTKSITWMVGRTDPLVKEREIGADFSIEVLGFSPITNSPYFYGMPYFLKSAQNMEVILRTIQLRTVMRMENPGAIVDETAVSFDPEVMRRLEANEIGDIIKLRLNDRNIDDVIKVREYGPALQYLRDLLAGVKADADEQFATYPETLGRKSFSQESGDFAEIMAASSSYLFVNFVNRLERYWPRVFRRVLDLAIEFYPKEIIATIAGENFPDRLKAIMEGEFADRISRVNVKVKMDMTTAADRNFAKQILSGFVAKLGVVTPGLLGELNIREPKRMSDEITTAQARLNKGAQIAKEMDQYPVLGQIYDATKQEYLQTIMPGNTAQS